MQRVKKNVLKAHGGFNNNMNKEIYLLAYTTQLVRHLDYCVHKIMPISKLKSTQINFPPVSCVLRYAMFFASYTVEHIITYATII
jgi:hypothetical protein